MDVELQGLSDNQKLFVKDAQADGLEVDFSYSGRHMYGATCPSVNVDDVSEGVFTKAKWRWDQMGLGYVLYAAV